MKKLVALMLLVCLMAPAAQAESGPVVSFEKKTDSITGGNAYVLVLTASAPFAADTQVWVKCEETGETYPVSFRAGTYSADAEIPTERTAKKGKATFTLVSGEEGVYTAAKNAKMTLNLLAVPQIRFYLDANYGFVGRDMSVVVACRNPGAVQNGGIYQLRDQTGRLYAQKEWNNLNNRLTFRFTVTEDMEGGKYFSVWKDGVRLSEIGDGYGAITDAKRGVIKQVETTEPYMSITLDCCYDDSKTDRVLAVLDEFNVKCTFFMAGYFVRNFPESARKIYEHGHEIGEHSSTHPRMTQKSALEQIRQIQRPTEDIETLLGIRVRLYRPPFGDNNQAVTALARGEGQEVIMWSMDSHDWDEAYKSTPEKVIRRDKTNAGPGSVILHHLDGFHVDDILRVIIPYYQEELGLTLVPVSELMAYGGRELPPLRIPDTLTELPEGME